MNIAEIKRALKNMPPKKSVLLEGGHGLGKSQVVAQVAQELSRETGETYGFVDIRLSQREVGDIIGMPRSVDKFNVSHTVYEKGKKTSKKTLVRNVTVNDIPTWYPTDKDSKGILFLDELNRATRDVQQAAFEIVLDYRLNFRDLPEGWRVVSAINEDQDTYAVLEIDPALLDRFLVIPFKPTVSEWETYAKKQVHPAVLRYIAKFPSDLDTPESVLPGKVYQSRRSWVSLSDCIKYMVGHGDDILSDSEFLIKIASGYVGVTTAVAFVDFIRKDYKVLSAKDILNRYDAEMDKDLKKMLVTEVAFYSKELVAYIAETGKKLSKNQSNNLLRYYKAIPKEAGAGFWSAFNLKCREISTVWYKNTEGVAAYTLNYLGKSSALNSEEK